MNNTDLSTLLELCHRVPLTDILNVLATSTIHHAHHLQDTLPDTAENASKIDRAFDRAQLLTNAIANLISTQTVDKDHPM